MHLRSERKLWFKDDRVLAGEYPNTYKIQRGDSDAWFA